MAYTTPNTTRRQALKALGAASALSVTGCCGLAPRQLPDSASERMHPSPFLLRPELRQLRTAATPVLDVHTHFFNAADVPVRAFLQKSVGHDQSYSLQLLLTLFAPAIEAVAKDLAPSAAEEWRTLQRMQQRFASMTPAAVSATLDDEAIKRASVVGTALYRELKRSAPDGIALFNSLTLGAERTSGRTGVGVDPLSEELLIRIIAESHDAIATEDSARTSDPAFNARRARAQGLRGLLEFAGFMLSPRYQNLNAYMKVYGAHSGSLQLAGCYASIVDFNYWLDCPAVSTHLHDQVILHAELSKLSGGFLKPLVGYNPWVDIKENDASLKLLDIAVHQYGFVGAKIYPPMGFLPYGNAEAGPIESREKRPDQQTLDRKLLAFFSYCAQRGIPVMAHANHSMGRDLAHDALAGPAGWHKLRSALATHQSTGKLKPLRINAGHFSGESIGDWTRGFVELAEQCDGTLDLYGDTGYWEGLLMDDAVSDHLVSLLSAASNGTCRVSEKMMFGSDWLMVSQVAGWKSYLAAFDTALDQRVSESARQAFFNGNARRFFRP